MKTLKTTNLTGYLPVDSKIVAGYDLFNPIKELENETSIIEELLQMNDEVKTKRILCNYFHYQELKFSENIFVSDYYDIPISFKTTKNHTPNYLCKFIHAPEDYTKQAYEYYQNFVEFEILKRNQTFWDDFYNLILKAAFTISILIFMSYPLIKELIIPVALIVNINLKNLITNMRSLSDMELERNAIET